jgi:hypothetical protein
VLCAEVTQVTTRCGGADVPSFGGWFTNSVNGADGLLGDEDDKLRVVATRSTRSW